MSLARTIIPIARKTLSTATGAALPPRKVAVLGAAGGIGQPLGLLLKMNPLVSELALFDIMATPGVACDISHVNTRAKTRGYLGNDQLKDALAGCDVVVIPAGVPRKPGMTRDDLFKINAGIVKGLCEAISKHCPTAAIAMISNPVNSTVPIAAQVFKRQGTYDPRKLFGVTTLDVVRANTFLAEDYNLDPKDVNVPVVGGHAGQTIIPLFSQATPHVEMDREERGELTIRVQDGGTEVVQAKAGKGSATLSMAYAGALFTQSLLRGLNGEDVVECTFVESTLTDAAFFASKVTLGPNGAEEIHPLGDINDFEKAAIRAALPELKESIAKGISFVEEHQ